MKLIRQFSLSTLFLALLSVPVFAQVPGLTRMGELLTGIFGGIIGGFVKSPEIWSKVILIIILFTILWALLGKLKFIEEHRNSRILLSIAISIGAIAPIPAELASGVFTGFGGLVGLILYILPIIGLMYLTHEMTHEEPARHKYIGAFALWAIALFAYIGPVAEILGPNITRISEAAGIVSLIAFGYLVWAIWGIFSPGTETRPEKSAAEIAKGKEAKAGRIEAGDKPAKTYITKACKNLRLAEGADGDAETARAASEGTLTALATDSANAANKSATRAAMRTLHDKIDRTGGFINRVTKDKTIMNYLNSLGSRATVGRGKEVAMLTQAVNQGVADMDWINKQMDALKAASPAMTPAQVTELKDRHADMKVIYGAGGDVLTAVSEILTDLEC